MSIIKSQKINHFYGKEQALKDVCIDIKKGEFVAITGESGSGKSLLLKTIMGLLPADLNSKGDLNVKTAEMEFNPLNCAEDKWLSIRGKEIGMIFQEPLSALNPQMRCGAQLETPFECHAYK